MHLILTGATGLVGSGALDAMIKDTRIAKISIISRRPVPMADDARDPRINVIIHKNFEQYDSSILEQLKDANSCVWALGISQSKVTKDEYITITKNYALAAARAFSSLSTSQGQPFRFVYVSGEGATPEAGHFTPTFARIKGETEVALAEMSNELRTMRVYSVRLGGVDASRHDAIKKYIPDPAAVYRAVGSILYTVMRTLMPLGLAPTDVAGDCFVRMAMEKLDDRLEGPGAVKNNLSWILNNKAMRRVAGR
ncbi:uncharacterized protein TRIREDRAFT_62977 [Trichoderma reesei QM6a]|jgi:hypothetical protein|uniref:Predicted protein n=2 Tax=Hypocrea jecorina TaxID=51453 RepID=G0RLB3_HYPJQ|nr:uncharacterized protein TRIREDRAFT_62977 [Trichoderma reesei QM6a]EGR48021.1 predicted protein [Trichoderma reesei QM6a]ETS01987.1 hypothetical protein M419DRAFT_78936 [Trichoderma reesei RUT C-30]